MDIKKYFNEKREEYKKKKEDDKRFLKRQKEIIKKEELLSDEIEKEYKEQVKKENAEKYKDMSKSEKRKQDIKEFIDDMLDNSEFEELKDVMTEKEKKEYEENKIKEKKYTIRVSVLFLSIIIFSIVGLLIFGEIVKTDLEKVTQPILEEYYKNTFNEKPKLSTIKYLDEDKHIVLATFKSGINVMCIDNETIGNDSLYEDVYKDYKTLLNTTISGTHMIQNQPKIIYSPYVVDYNYYIDYIDVLPSNKTFNEMYQSNSLDITDTIIYEGDINKENIFNLVKRLGDNSLFYLIKMSSQNILNLTIINKAGIYSYDVTETKYTGDSDIFYMFDQNINKIEFVDITNYSPGYDRTNTYYYTNVKRLKVKESYLSGFNKEEDKRSHIYLLKLNKNANYDKFRVLDRQYDPLELNKYPFIMTINSSTGLIVIGEKEISFGNEEVKSNSFLCRLNLC